jgi:hypothetical protein
MKTLLSIAFVALATVAVSTPVAQADNARGTCNRIVANTMSSAQACYNFDCAPTSLECADFGAAFLSFFGDPACAVGFVTGELDGLGGDAATMPDGSSDPGTSKHIGEVVCTAIASCGFCEAAGGIGGFGDCAGLCP